MFFERLTLRAKPPHVSNPSLGETFIIYYNKSLYSSWLLLCAKLDLRYVINIKLFILIITLGDRDLC